MNEEILNWISDVFSAIVDWFTSVFTIAASLISTGLSNETTTAE